MAKFQVGHKGGPGRPLGARNKIGEAFLEDILQHWKKYGKEAIQLVFEEDTATYLKVVANILPKELIGENIGPLVNKVTVVFVKADGKNRTASSPGPQ